MSKTSSVWWRGTRGEWYVAAQLVLMAVVFFGPRSAPGLPAGPPALVRVSGVVGAVLMGCGGLLLVAGVTRLGRNLSPLPHPKDGGTLVASGPYRFVRHPIYAGGILLAYGWAFVVRGPLTLGYATVLLLFLEVKATREERWLVSRFPEYREYQRRVAKLLPWVH